MSVIINLKEIFSTDSQSEISSKLNFNFNQLLALGVGQPGPVGPAGTTGQPGPIGPIGPIGPVGSMIFGAVPPVQIAAPNPSTVPTEFETNDILITDTTIIKKVDLNISATGWQKIADFNTLVENALSSNISPYVRLTPTARVVKSRITSGVDLSNSSNPNDPTFPIAGLGENYQTVLYNFNELKTSSVILSGGIIQISSNSSVARNFSALTAVNSNTDSITINTHGLTNGQYVTYSTEGGNPVGGLTNFNGYFVLVVDSNTIKLCESLADVTANNPVDLTSAGTGSTPHKLITYPASADTIFPATSNLTLYSYFNNTASPAKQFDTNPSNKGYRYQLELGSVDTLTTSYSNGVTGPAYVISPSFENLRIRKYRLAYVNVNLGNESSPGKYYLRAEYDLSSDGIQGAPESFSPRRNSEQCWKINKSLDLETTTRTIEMKLTNSVLLEELESASGISVDGVFLKRSATFDGTTSPVTYFGMGFSPSSATSYNFELSSGMTFSFNRSVNVGTTRINPAGIEYTGSAGTTWSLYALGRNIAVTAINFQVVGNLAATGTLNIGTVNTATGAGYKTLVLASTGEVQKVDAAPIPVGGIIMWSGLISAIPSGWALCDGANGTPDLRNRFIVGSHSDSSGQSRTTITGAPTKSGGSLTHTHTAQGTALTVGQLPSHQHEYQDAYFAENGGHKPAGNVGGSGDTDSSDNGFFYRTRTGGGTTTPPPAGARPLTDPIGSGQTHTHVIDQATVLPPYFALAFIMYLGVEIVPTTTTTTTSAPTTTTSTTSTTTTGGSLTPFIAIAASYISSTGACSGSGPTTTLYHNGTSGLPTIGDRVYTDAAGTSPMFGGSGWTAIPGGLGNSVIQVNNSGFVIDNLLCSGGFDGGLCCFLPGTLITLADGTTKEIENIEVGDIVMSYNETSHSYSTNEVIETVSPVRTSIYECTLSNGDSIKMTPDHPVYSVANGWTAIDPEKAIEVYNIPVEALEVGDILLGNNGNLEVTGIKRIEGLESTTHTLSLKDKSQPSYFANGILAHNIREAITCR